MITIRQNINENFNNFIYYIKQEIFNKENNFIFIQKDMNDIELVAVQGHYHAFGKLA